MSKTILQVEEYKYDVFLSHASEDKEDIARPLALALQQRGLRVWFDEFELRIGDKLIAKLNAGMNASQFGILVLSQNFSGKNWTEYELNTLETMAVSDDYILFPILHNISADELRAYRASLATIIARSTATYTIEEIAIEIHEIILESRMLE